IGLGDAMLLGEIEHVVAACGHRRHLHVHAVDPLVGVHVQFGDEAASNEAYSHLRHGRPPCAGFILAWAAPRNSLRTSRTRVRGLVPPRLPGDYRIAQGNFVHPHRVLFWAYSQCAIRRQNTARCRVAAAVCEPANATSGTAMDVPPEHVLSGDIGATNARLSLLSK